MADIIVQGDNGTEAIVGSAAPVEFVVSGALIGPQGTVGPAGPAGPQGDGTVESVVAGDNITVDDTDPANPIVSAADNAVDSVNGQTGAIVLDTDDIADTASNRFTDDTAIARLANTSGNNTGDQDLSPYQLLSEKGQANGYAPLDNGGKVPVANLPASVMTYLGTWNATTNTPTLVNGTGDPGDLYIVSVAGTHNFGAGNITFEVGDWVMYNGTIWQRSDMSDAVSSVFGRQGAVTAQAGDYTASLITNTPSGNIAATDVQGAITELDTEKLALAGGTMIGALTLPELVLNTSTLSEIRTNATANQLHLSGGTAANGAQIYLAGSTHATLANTGRFFIGGTEQMRWNGTGFAFGQAGLNATHTLTLPSTATGIALYNTSDQTTNYERVRQYWQTNAFNIQTEFGGTGTGRDLVLGTTSTQMFIRYAQSANGSYQFSRSLSNGGTIVTAISGTMTQSSSSVVVLSITPTITQTGTAGYTALLVNPTESTTGSGSKLLADFQIGGVSKFKVNDAGRVTIDSVDGSAIDTDGTLAANSDTKLASQKAVKTYAKKSISTGTARRSGETVRDYRLLGDIYANGITTVTPSTNRWIFEFYTITEPITLDRVAVEVTTASAAGKLARMAIYTADDYWQPATLVQDFGTVATDVGAVPTVQAITISLTLQPGRYVGIIIQDGLATFRTFGGFSLSGNAISAAGGTSIYRDMASLNGTGTVSGGFASVSPAWERDVYKTGAGINYFMRFRELV